MPEYVQAEFDFKYPKKEVANEANKNPLFDLDKFKSEMFSEMQTLFDSKYQSVYQELQKKEEELKAKDEVILDLERKIGEYSLTKPIVGKETQNYQDNITDSKYNSLVEKLDSLSVQVNKLYENYAVSIQPVKPVTTPKLYTGYTGAIQEYKSTLKEKIMPREERKLVDKIANILSGKEIDEKTGKAAYSWDDRQANLSALLDKYSGSKLSEVSKDAIGELKNIVDNNKYLSRNNPNAKGEVLSLLEGVVSNESIPPNYSTSESSIEDVFEKVHGAKSSVEKKKEETIESAIEKDYSTKKDIKVSFNDKKSREYQDLLENPEIYSKDSDFYNPANREKNLKKLNRDIDYSKSTIHWKLNEIKSLSTVVDWRNLSTQNQKYNFAKYEIINALKDQYIAQEKRARLILGDAFSKDPEFSIEQYLSNQFEKLIESNGLCKPEQYTVINKNTVVEPKEKASINLHLDNKETANAKAPPALVTSTIIESNSMEGSVQDNYVSKGKDGKFVDRAKNRVAEMVGKVKSKFKSKK